MLPPPPLGTSETKVATPTGIKCLILTTWRRNRGVWTAYHKEDVKEIMTVWWLFLNQQNRVEFFFCWISFWRNTEAKDQWKSKSSPKKQGFIPCFKFDETIPVFYSTILHFDSRKSNFERTTIYWSILNHSIWCISISVNYVNIFKRWSSYNLRFLSVIVTSVSGFVEVKFSNVIHSVSTLFALIYWKNV